MSLGGIGDLELQGALGSLASPPQFIDLVPRDRDLLDDGGINAVPSRAAALATRLLAGAFDTSNVAAIASVDRARKRSSTSFLANARRVREKELETGCFDGAARSGKGPMRSDREARRGEASEMTAKTHNEDVKTHGGYTGRGRSGNKFGGGKKSSKTRTEAGRANSRCGDALPLFGCYLVPSRVDRQTGYA